MIRAVRRIGRHILNAFTVVSLTLCVAIVVVWARSYWHDYWFSYVTEDYHYCTIRTPRGAIVFWLTVGTAEMRAGSYWPVGAQHGVDDPTDADSRFADKSFWGLNWRHRINPRHRIASETVAAVHDGYFVVLFAILPLRYALWRLRTRRRLRSGHCPRCNYDLRATPDRCPECGASVARPAAKSAAATS